MFCCGWTCQVEGHLKCVYNPFNLKIPSLNEEVAEVCEVETSSPKPKPSPYSCQLCQKAFTYSKDLKNHLLGK